MNIVLTCLKVAAEKYRAMKPGPTPMEKQLLRHVANSLIYNNNVLSGW